MGLFLEFVGLDLNLKLVVLYMGQLALTPIGASFLALVRFNL